MRLAFVCVRNAGRSQMAAAFAERERDERGLDWELDDPDGKSPEAVAAIRDEIERRVVALFDEVEDVED